MFRQRTTQSRQERQDCFTVGDRATAGVPDPKGERQTKAAQRSDYDEDEPRPHYSLADSRRGLAGHLTALEEPGRISTRGRVSGPVVATSDAPPTASCAIKANGFPRHGFRAASAKPLWGPISPDSPLTRDVSARLSTPQEASVLPGNLCCVQWMTVFQPRPPYLPGRDPANGQAAIRRACQAWHGEKENASPEPAALGPIVRLSICHVPKSAGNE